MMGDAWHPNVSKIFVVVLVTLWRKSAQVICRTSHGKFVYPNKYTAVNNSSRETVQVKSVVPSAAKKTGTVGN